MSGSDPTVGRLRREISEIDESIVAAVNARLEVVARLKRHKASLGLPFVDRSRESDLIDALVAVNDGQLSEDGLRELYACLLDLTKREVSTQ
jgi:chorismate mutase